MQTYTLREALKSLNYREMQPKKWMKPVGFHLLTFCEVNNQFCNWYLSGTGEDCCWDTFEPSEEQLSNILYYIKQWETDTKKNISVSEGSQYQLPVIDI